jgi:hypothetical protein
MIYLHDDGIAGKKVRKTPSWATTSAFYCCAPTKLHEQICIFCATLKTFSLQAEITALGKLLKNAKFGANFSPTGYYTDPNTGDQNCLNYIGWTFQWVRVFREEALTLPWCDPISAPGTGGTSALLSYFTIVIT